MGYARGTRWTDDLIREKILEVKSALELERMPSRAECGEYFHNEGLVSAVSRRKGWYALADELGLSIKDSETKLGKTWEFNAVEILTSRGFSCRKMAQNFPYDILVNDCIKVDIKASHIYHGPHGDFFTFNLNKPFSTCDVYVLFSLDDKNSIGRSFVVPSKFVPTQNQISIGVSTSSYNRFVDRWDYFDVISNFWDDVS